MGNTDGKIIGNISLVVMQAMAASALFSCGFICLGSIACREGTSAQALVVARLCGIASCALALSRPSLAERVAHAERSHALAFGASVGLVLLASFAGLQVPDVALPGRIVLAILQGAACWLGFSACVFLADVLELDFPMRTIAIGAAIAAVVAYAAIASGGCLPVYALVAVLGSAALTAELAEAASVPPNGEDKLLVNIFKYFNPRAPLANAISGAVFGVSAAFLVGYGAVGPDCAAFAAAGVLAAGFVPRVGNDGAANRAYVVLLALAIAFVALLPIDGKRVASGAVVGLNAFYFMRNVGWAYGQCLKLGSLDTAILSRALAPFLLGTAGGCAIGAALAAMGAPEVSAYAGTVMLVVVVVDAVYFMPFLASPFAREAGQGAEEDREHVELAKSLLDDEPRHSELGGEAAEPVDPDSMLRARCAVVAQEDGLTERERDILFLLCKGRTASYIGDELFISKNTAKVHISHIYNKTDIHSQQELMSYVDSIEVD